MRTAISEEVPGILRALFGAADWAVKCTLSWKDPYTLHVIYLFEVACIAHS